MEEFATDHQWRSRRQVGAGTGDDPAVACREDSEGTGRYLAVGLARQGIFQHGAELGRGIENDGDAAEHVAIVVADCRAVDVCRLAIVEVADGEFRHRVTLAVGQGEGRPEPGSLQRLAGQVAVSRIGNGKNPPRAVEQDQVAINGIELVDAAQHLGQVLLLTAVARQQACHFLAKRRIERPPAAIVGSFIKVAIHDVDSQFRLYATVEQQGREHGTVEIVRRFGEHVAGTDAGAADLAQQHLGESGALRSTRLPREPDVTVPYRAIQFALDCRGAQWDVAQDRAETMRGGEHTVDEIVRYGGQLIFFANLEGVMQGGEGVTDPAGTGVTLVAVADMRGGQVFPSGEANDAAGIVGHWFEAGTGGYLIGITAGDDLALAIKERQNGPVVRGDQSVENAPAFIFEAEA